MRLAPVLSRRTLALALALTLVASALPAMSCSRSDTAAEPVWGKEPCAHCRMLVSASRYAAQASSDGERYFFDDVGCLILWMDAHKAAEKAWVHDASSNAWLEARTARYITGARTPMDFGLEAHVATGITFEAARDAVRARKRSSR